MEKEKKIKIFLGPTYVLIILSFLWVFFDNFSLSEISSYDFIKNHTKMPLHTYHNAIFWVWVDIAPGITIAPCS